MTDPEAGHVIEIRGRAGLAETAAIAGVITHLLEEEAAAVASPSTRPAQSAWVVAGLPRHVPSPLPSHTYSSVRWSDTDEVEPAE